ncbi:hypothetical protein E4185_14605 [Aeromonas media]|nr:hypothetical protein E4185_14605 [Aeromonas media]
MGSSPNKASAMVGVVTNDLSSAHRGADVVLIGTPDGVVTQYGICHGRRGHQRSIFRPSRR